MLKIYLVRHGQDEDNVAGVLNGHHDTNLTALGLNQARELAAFIKEQNLSFIKVFCSPLKRAYQTALEITKINNFAEPEVLPLLIERDFGVLTGKRKEDIDKFSKSILKTETIDYFLDVAEAESFPETLVRAKKLLNFILDNYSAGNILLVSHGDFGKMIYAAYYNLSWEQALKSFHFGNTEMVLLSPEALADNVKIFQAPQFNS